MTDYATLLRDHVTLKVRSIDRIFLQAYVPNLQTVGLVCRFLRWQRNFRIPSSAAFGKIGEQYVQAIDRFAAQRKIPRLQFQKGQDKEETGSPLFASRSESGPRSRGPDRNGAREGLGLALLAAQRTGKGGSSAHGLGPADGLPQPFLFLPVGCRMGCNVLENQCLCSLSDLALAERA